MKSRALSQQLFDAVFGFDFFISYTWRDGAEYAAALHRKLTNQGFTVFLDRQDFAHGDNWSVMGKRAIQKTKQLILVATPAIHDSKPVQQEVEAFIETGRRIISIELGHGLSPENHKDSKILNLLPAELLRLELDDSNDIPLEPQAEVVTELRRGFNHVRQTQFRLRVMMVVSCLLLAFAAAAVWFGISAQYSANEAKLQSGIAKQKAFEAQASAKQAMQRLSESYFDRAQEGFRSGDDSAGLAFLGVSLENDPDREDVATFLANAVWQRHWATPQEHSFLGGRVISCAVAASQSRMAALMENDIVAICETRSPFSMHRIPLPQAKSKKPVADDEVQENEGLTGFSISDDGNHVAIFRGDSLVVASAPDFSPKSILCGPISHRPVFSPDSALLAYAEHKKSEGEDLVWKFQWHVLSSDGTRHISSDIKIIEYAKSYGGQFLYWMSPQEFIITGAVYATGSYGDTTVQDLVSLKQGTFSTRRLALGDLGAPTSMCQNRDATVLAFVREDAGAQTGYLAQVRALKSTPIRAEQTAKDVSENINEGNLPDGVAIVVEPVSGNLTAVADPNNSERFIFWDNSGVIYHCHTVENGAPVANVHRVNSTILDAGFLPGSPWVYAILDDSKLQLWDSTTREPVFAQITCPEQLVTCFAIPGSSQFAVLDRAGHLYLFALASRRFVPAPRDQTEEELKVFDTPADNARLAQFGLSANKVPVGQRESLRIFFDGNAQGGSFSLRPWADQNFSERQGLNYVADVCAIDSSPYAMALFGFTRANKYVSIEAGEGGLTTQWFHRKTGSRISLPMNLIATETVSHGGIDSTLLKMTPNEVGISTAVGWADSTFSFPLIVPEKGDFQLLAAAARYLSGINIAADGSLLASTFENRQQLEQELTATIKKNGHEKSSGRVASLLRWRLGVDAEWPFQEGSVRSQEIQEQSR